MRWCRMRYGVRGEVLYTDNRRQLDAPDRRGQRTADRDVQQPGLHVPPGSRRRGRRRPHARDGRLFCVDLQCEMTSRRGRCRRRSVEPVDGRGIKGARLTQVTHSAVEYCTVRSIVHEHKADPPVAYDDIIISLQVRCRRPYRCIARRGSDSLAGGLRCSRAGEGPKQESSSVQGRCRWPAEDRAGLA